ncbi:hypothetical protein CDAR_2791, partial [Caerostris darwini]
LRRSPEQQLYNNPPTIHGEQPLKRSPTNNVSFSNTSLIILGHKGWMAYFEYRARSLEKWLWSLASLRRVLGDGRKTGGFPCFQAETLYRWRW